MKKLFKNRVIVGVLCIVFAAIVAFAGVPIVSHMASTSQKVVCAASSIGMGEKITQDKLILKELGSLNLPEDITADMSQIVGKYATMELAEGDMVQARKLSETLTLPETRLSAMTGDQQEVVVNIGGSYIGQLLPGDIIRCVTYNKQGEVEDIPELQYVEVITTRTASGDNILRANQVDASGARMVPTTIMFILNSEQMKAMMELKRANNVSFILKYRMPANTPEYQQEAKNLLAIQAGYFNTAGRK